jgi:hypothetical protein
VLSDKLTVIAKFVLVALLAAALFAPTRDARIQLLLILIGVSIFCIVVEHYTRE